MSAFLSEMLMPERKPMSVRRCLFGAIDDNDREQLHKELDNQAKQIDDAEQKRFMDRWEFDPVKGAPMSKEGGTFEYTLLDNKSIPAVYSAGYRRRPSRPVSMLRVRSPCTMRNVLTSSAPRPTKRKLRFDMDSDDSNDENREVAVPESIIIQQPKMARVMDIVESHTSSNDEPISPSPSVVHPTSSVLLSPSSSPQVSSLPQCPPSPSVLSSSCPPVFESDSVRERLQCPISGLSRSLSESSFDDLSVVSPSLQAREYVTPSVRIMPAKLVQRVITDYGSIKKKRTGKPSPRS